MLYNYMNRPQNSFNPTPTPKNSPLGPQNIKNDPKIRSKSEVRIKRTIENKSWSPKWVNLKTVAKPYSNPKLAH